MPASRNPARDLLSGRDDDPLLQDDPLWNPSQSHDAPSANAPTAAPSGDEQEDVPVAHPTPLSPATVRFSPPPQYPSNACTVAISYSPSRQERGDWDARDLPPLDASTGRTLDRRRTAATRSDAADEGEYRRGGSGAHFTDSLWSAQAASPPSGECRTAIVHTEDAGAGLLDDLNNLMDEGWRFVRMDITSGQMIRIHLGQRSS